MYSFTKRIPDLVSRLSSNTLWRGLVYTFYIRAARGDARRFHLSLERAPARAHTCTSISDSVVTPQRRSHSSVERALSAQRPGAANTVNKANRNLAHIIIYTVLFRVSLSLTLSVTVSRYHTITNQSKHTRLVLRLLPWGHPLAAGLRLYAASYAGSGYRPQPHG